MKTKIMVVPEQLLLQSLVCLELVMWKKPAWKNFLEILWCFCLTLDKVKKSEIENL
jgi:hypothetical protein